MPHPDRRPHVARAAALAAAVLAVAVLVAPAHAGLGDMMNKAKKALGTSVTPKSPEGAAASGGSGKVPEFNDVVLELTEARVAKIAEALKLDGPADQKRAALQKQQESVRDQMSAIQDKYGHEMDVARNKRDEVEDCYGRVLGPLQEQHEKEMQQKMMSDPALQKQMMELSQQMAKAQSAGDMETVKRLQDKLAGMAGNTHADTLAAQQKCGSIPPPHPQQAKLDALEKQSAALDEQMRGVDDGLRADHEKISGLNSAQFAMAQERLEMYLAASQGGKKAGGVTENEAKAIEAHRAELEAVLRH